MMNLLLVRHAYLPQCTLGRLYTDGLMLCTLEESWTVDPDGPGGQKREPGHYESCVPDGTYELRPHSGARFQRVWTLVNPELGVYLGAPPSGQTWGRGAILIHNGNVVDHTVGCILVGKAFVGFDRVMDSRVALDELRAVLGHTETHRLEIRPCAGTSET